MLILFCLFLFVLPSVSSGEPQNQERLIVYSSPGNTTGNGAGLNLSGYLSDNVTLAGSSPLLGYYVVTVPFDRATEYQNSLLLIPGVVLVERDVLRHTESYITGSPNDPKYSEQWALNRTHVPEAWRQISGPANITIAVVDTGVDTMHEDLSSIIDPKSHDWTGSVKGVNDTFGHGTHLAGIIGAVGNNTRGICGIAPVKILAEKVGTNQTDIYASRSAMGIQHAADSGAEIILVGYGGCDPSIAEERAIRYAISKGCIIIASAGDEDSNMRHYPSDFDDVISVGSTAKTDGLSYFSNYGIFVELVAPGEEVLSTWPDGQYTMASGTSQSSAVVAGIAALALCKERTLTREQVHQILDSSTTDLGRTGRDIYYGYGLIDAAKVVKAAGEIREEKKIADIKTAYTQELQNSTRRTGSVDNATMTELSLHQGWNFISFPLPLKSGKNTGDIFKNLNTEGHTIWKFRSSDQNWTAMDKDSPVTPLEGMLVYSVKESEIPVMFGDNVTSPACNLTPGWNLVGSPSLKSLPAKEALNSVSTDWISLLTYNTSLRSYDSGIINGAEGIYSDSQNLSPLTAHWLYMDKPGILRSK